MPASVEGRLYVEHVKGDFGEVTSSPTTKVSPPMLVTVNSRVLAAVYQSQRRVGRLLWSGDVRLDVLFGYS